MQRGGTPLAELLQPLHLDPPVAHAMRELLVEGHLAQQQARQARGALQMASEGLDGAGSEAGTCGCAARGEETCG